MKTFFKIFLLTTSVIALTSCGKLKKTSAFDKSITDSTATTRVEETTITTRAVDTVATIKADTSTAVIPLPPDTTTVKVIDTDTHAVTIQVDSAKKTIKIVAVSKKKEIPITINETTTTHRKEKSKVDVSKKEVSKEAVKKRTMFPWWFVWLLLVLVAVYYAGRWFLKRYTYTITKKPPN